MTGKMPSPSQPKQPIDKAYSIASIKAYRLANLDLPVKETSVVTYVVNGIRSKYPDAACVTRLREKSPTFDELRSMMLLEESDMSTQSISSSLLHASSSSPTVLVVSTTPHDKANTMSASDFDVCCNFQRSSCSYGACCKFVHGENDLRPHPPTTGLTAQGRAESNSMSRPSHVVPHMASKTTTSNTNRMVDASVVAQCQSTQPVRPSLAVPHRWPNKAHLAQHRYYASISVSNDDSPTTILEHGYWGVLPLSREHKITRPVGFFSAVIVPVIYTLSPNNHHLLQHFLSFHRASLRGTDSLDT
ncbi:Toll/interleukin-1 receptor domain-containing protein [Tanacetum coccineum]